MLNHKNHGMNNGIAQIPSDVVGWTILKFSALSTVKLGNKNKFETQIHR